MDKETLIKNRDFITGTNHINLNDGIARPLTIHLMLNNSYGFNTAVVPVIWDDENERLFAFGVNSYDFQGGMNYGKSNPLVMTILPYEFIEQIKVVLSEIDFDAMCDKMGTLMTAAQRENIRTKFFKLTDPEYNIKQRQQSSY